MPLPRQDCPHCGRNTAIMLRGGDPYRLYRHDPPEHPPGNLVSCPGSLSLVEAVDARQPALFGDALLAAVYGDDQDDADDEDAALF